MKTNGCKSLIQPVFLTAISTLMVLIGTAIVSAQTVETDRENEQSTVRKIILTAREGKGDKDKNLIKRRTIKIPKSTLRSENITVCNIEIKNNSNYRIDVYINEVRKGGVGNLSSFKTTTDVGWIKVYARTDRVNNNTYYYWGPNTFSCGNNLKDGNVLLEINFDNKND